MPSRLATAFPLRAAGVWRAQADPFFISLLLLSLASAALATQRVPPTEEVFRRFSARIVKIEVQEKDSEAKASIGSGFYVSDDGYLVTNYHVVADVVLQPDRYRALLVAPDDSEGSPVEILDVDVAHDLAIVKGPAHGSYFELREQETPQGLRLYSLGHPLDLGLNIVEGTYNGFLKHALDERIHFTGSLNPGMSGGPAITAEGDVIGINVATAGEQVSFLVPVKWAVALLARTRSPEFHADSPLLEVVRRQMFDYQERFVRSLSASPPPTVNLGGFTLPTRPAPYFNCWADAYREDRLTYDTVDHQCSTDDYIFVSDELVSGELWFYHRLLDSDELNRFQFAALYTDDFDNLYHGMGGSESEVTPFRCHTDTVRENGLTLKAVFCLRRYRKLGSLYDLVFKAAAIGKPGVGLETALMASGVSYENAEAVVRWYLGSIAWTE